MKNMLFILLGLGFLVACASPAPSSTPAPQIGATPKPTIASANNQALVSSVKAGDWIGSGENNFTISFTVGNGGNTIVKGIQVSFKATCGTNASNISDTLGASETLSFQAGEIKFTNENYEITGKAVAADRIEGTLKADGIKLGKLGQCSASGIVWSASPK